MQSGPASYRLLLGRRLREQRERAGVSQADAASELGAAPAKISKIEQGAATLRASEVDRLLVLYRVAGEDATDIRDLAASARKRGSYGKVPDWARQYLSLESDANRIVAYDGELVPGLFQIRDYALAVVRTSPVVAAVDVERVVDARIRRQDIFDREKPPDVHLIIGEAALYRQVGGARVLAEQLGRLAELSESSSLVLQVLPFATGAHAAIGCNFTVVDVALGDASSSWVYLEDLTRADCLSGEGHVSAYRLTWEHLVSKALPEHESMSRLRQAITDLER